MKNNKTLIILILAFVVLLGGAYILYSQLGESQTPDQLSVEQQENSETEENQKTLAPDFTVYDADGNEVKPVSYTHLAGFKRCIHAHARTSGILTAYSAKWGKCFKRQYHYTSAACDIPV